MTDIDLYSEKIFEDIKHYTEEGIEFWYARELQGVLEYKEWRNFVKVIDKAKEACENAQQSTFDHFADVGKMVTLGSGSEREIEDIMLSRYACYLIVMNVKKNRKNYKAHNYFTQLSAYADGRFCLHCYL